MPNPGDPFEKLVAEIQARVDPNATVTHNEFLIDRLQQRRQFDVVIRGQFAGRSMLGVIECKDLKGKVGTPEVDAFHTKAQDVNANFKIIASRRGFSKPALVKAQHYGIGAVSLLDPTFLDGLEFGDWWTAKVFRWKAIHIQAHPADPHVPEPQVAPNQLLVNGGRVIDWFTNHLLKEGPKDESTGWVVNFQLVFEPPIPVVCEPEAKALLCKAISFHAERECLEYERFVPLAAEALVDWHAKKATIPPNTTVRTQDVPMDFHGWDRRKPGVTRTSCLMPVAIQAHEHQFDFIPSAPDLDAL